MWDVIGPDIKPGSLALASGFFTTEPPWKPSYYLYPRGDRAGPAAGAESCPRHGCGGK